MAGTNDGRIRFDVEAWAKSDSAKRYTLALVKTYFRPEAEQQAATDHVRSAEQHADEWDEECGPLWLGHALHQAFLSGIDWQKEQRDGARDERTPGAAGPGDGDEPNGPDPERAAGGGLPATR